MTNAAATEVVQKDITTKEAATILNVSVPRVHALIKEKRILGAYKVGVGRGFWLMPPGEEGKPTVLPPTGKKNIE